MHWWHVLESGAVAFDALGGSTAHIVSSSVRGLHVALEVVLGPRKVPLILPLFRRLGHSLQVHVHLLQLGPLHPVRLRCDVVHPQGR